MIEHLFLDAQNVAGAVDEDSSGASGAEPIVLAAEQGRGAEMTTNTRAKVTRAHCSNDPRDTCIFFTLKDSVLNFTI